jgi:4,5-DOPA dioxygenase extradiol
MALFFNDWSTTMTPMPTLFVSHGAPTFAIEPGKLGPLLTDVGAHLPRPTAIAVVSPHWMTSTVRVTMTPQPKTIHDFGGFPDALYAIEYPAPGAPEVARRAAELLRADGWPVDEDVQRGLDHGAWVPLTYLYPDASIPVIQISMPLRLDSRTAYMLGRSLSALRNEGVLIVASGSMTHNLYEFRTGDVEEAQYAKEFAGWINDTVVSKDHAKLVQTMQLAPHAQRAHPTIEHFLPLLVAAGAAGESADVTLLEGGVTHGVLSMDSFIFAGPERSQ